MEISIYTDGGARGNPGPSAIGVVIKDHKGKVLEKIGKFIGSTTNNDAEYKALLEGLQTAGHMGAKIINCHLDSELVVKQMNGNYKVKNSNLKTLWKEIKILENTFSKVTYRHIPREKNYEADALVNQVLDSLN